MIKYKDYEIDETKDIFNLTPEEVFRYADSLPISKKRKLKFIDLYNTFKLSGVTNIDISDDIPKFTFNGEIDLSNRKDSEVAGYVVDYLNKGLRKKYTSLTKEKEEKEKNIPLYTNESFQNDIQEQIIRDYFKGRKDVNLNKEWDDVLDKRNEETGLYSTEGRAKVFSDQLRNYANSLKEDSYKFDETTPFKSLDEFKTALNSAADKLANNDLSGLNDIGFPQSKWFSDRGEDPFTDSEGNTYTAKDYYSTKYLQELKKLEEEVLALQLKQAKIDLGNKGILTLTSGIHGIDAKTRPLEYAQYLSKYGTGQQGFLRISQEVLNLLEKAYNGGGGNGLNVSEKRQLGNFLYYIRSNNPKYKGLGNGKTNITQLEFEELKKSKYIGDLPMGNIIRLPWKTSDGRYTYADNRGNVYYLKPSNHLKYADISVDKDKMLAYNTYIKRVGKSEEQLKGETPVLKLDKDILISDMTSMLGDIVSIGGGLAGVAGGVTSLLSDLYGDLRRGKDTLGVIKNLGANLAWGTAGLIPGVKLGKVAKTAARVYAGLLSAGIIMDPEIHKSFQNLVNGKGITAKDFENFKWALHAVTGGVNATRAHFTERNIESKIKTSTVETKSGKLIPITLEQIDRINKTGRRGGLAAAERQFKEMFGEEVKPGSFKFPEGTRKKYHPFSLSKKLHSVASSDKKLATFKRIDLNKVNEFLEQDKNKPIVSIIGNPFKGEYWTRNNPFNERFWNEGGPNRGGLTYTLSSYKNVNSEKNPSSESSEVLINHPYPIGQGKLDIKRPLPVLHNLTLPLEFLDFYIRGIDNKQFGLINSFNPLSSIHPGTVTVEFGGKKLTFKWNDKERKDPIKDINKFRKLVADKILPYVLLSFSAEAIEAILKLKQLGFLKLGGIIDKQRILKYKEYIRK